MVGEALNHSKILYIFSELITRLMGVIELFFFEQGDSFNKRLKANTRARRQITQSQHLQHKPKGLKVGNRDKESLKPQVRIKPNLKQFIKATS